MVEDGVFLTLGDLAKPEGIQLMDLICLLDTAFKRQDYEQIVDRLLKKSISATFSAVQSHRRMIATKLMKSSLAIKWKRGILTGIVADWLC